VIAEAVLATVLMLTPGSMPSSPPPPTASVSDPDQTGRQPSAYTGRKYRAEHEQFRLCVAQREGRFQYGVTGSNGFYESTYQMTDALVRGAAWEMRDELVDTWGRAGWRTFRVLLRTPGRNWSRFYMDMAFWTILNARGDLSGARHWAGGRFTCQPGMASYGGDR
jgi:hypothetical protein